MEQRSEEWFEARKGRVTASMVGAILGVSPNLSRAGAMRRMVRDAHGAEPEFTGNIATQYGERNEDGAVDEYYMETGNKVQVGFVTKEDWAGCSPDSLINDDGGLEAKCPFGKRETGGSLSEAGCCGREGDVLSRRCGRRAGAGARCDRWRCCGTREDAARRRSCCA